MNQTCPKCGSPPVLDMSKDILHYYYKCIKCDVSSNCSPTKDGAAKEWDKVYGDNVEVDICYSCKKDIFAITKFGAAICMSCHGVTDENNVITYVKASKREK